ncbi:MAG: M14 family zinc carboxypeptidase [Arachnia sp.]
MRHLIIAVLGAVTLLVTGAFPGPSASADVKGSDVYTTPGVHQVNGRSWKTTCEAYSSAVERCRSEIWGQRVLRIDNRWNVEEGWVFNNLTYRPSPRATWSGNPLATPGEHTVGGRRWLTRCDDAWTGRGGCRSLIWSTGPTVVGGRVRTVTGWVFNNIVQFSGTSVPAVRPTPRKPNGTVIDHAVLGESREGRPIEAWLVGDPAATKVAVVIGQMHGEERYNNRTAWEIIKDPRRVTGVQLWVIPTMNPDGEAMGRRQNAAGVDLNGNFGTDWVAETGRYGTGSGPWSEPESRAVRDFLTRIRPGEVVSMHSPLRAVDSYGLKSRDLHDRLVRHLGLPSAYLNCRRGACHGTMTQWFNTTQPGAAITIEYGYAPSHDYYTRAARNGIVKALGGTYTSR